MIINIDVSHTTSSSLKINLQASSNNLLGELKDNTIANKIYNE
jgi:hypothetical protein